jgi:hypothetical protein
VRSFDESKQAIARKFKQAQVSRHLVLRSARNYKYEIRYQEKYNQWKKSFQRWTVPCLSLAENARGFEAQLSCSAPQPCATMSVAQSTSELHPVLPSSKYGCTENHSVAPICSYV